MFNTMGVSVPGIEEHNQSWTNIMYEADISGSKPTCISEGDIIGNRRFEGWYTGPDYITEFNFVGAKMPFVANEGNVYIFAKWSPLDYRVEYYLSRTATVFWEDDGVEEGGYANQLTPPSPDPEHDEFLAWYWNNPDTGAFEPFAFETPFTEDSTDENGVIKLYAVWNVSGLTVTYLPNASDTTGEAPEDYNTYSGGTIVTVKDQNTLARENYLFGGWSTEDTGPAMYQPDETFVITEDTTLYAVWIPMVNVTVTKAWDDNSDQDGLRPAKLLLVLNGSDGSSRQYELSGTENTWSHTFTNLPKYHNHGTEIVYTVNEPTVPTGYTESYDQDTLTVTNTHTPATTTKTVSKAWVDNDNQDGLRTDVTLKLVATVDGAEVAWADLKAASASKADMDDDGLVTLTGKVNESHEFTHLPEKYQGKDVVYTVNEPTVPTGYTESYDQDTLTVTNTHTPATTTKTVSKAWVDNDNQDGLRTDVTLKLVATVDGAEVAWADLKAASASKADMDDDGLVTLTGKVNESHEFTHLPEKYQGKDVVYTVNEPTVPTGYTESYDQDTLTVTNTHTPATTTKTVSKAWVDNDNQDGLRTDVTLKLVATVDGAEVAWADLKAASASKADMDDDGLVTLTGKVNESHEFTHLPEKYQGKDVVYTVNEPTVPTGYTESYDQDTLTVTNTHTPATTTKTVSKAWVDNDNQDGLRTDVTLKLVATVDGAEVAWADLKAASASKADMDDDGLVTLTGKVNESHEFTHLPEKYQGKDVVYTVNEPTVPTGYTESYDQDTLTVTNTHTPATTTKTVSKAWVDNDNQDGLRTDVTLKLVATVDGAEVAWADLKAASASKADMDDDGLVTLTGKVNESHEFTHLPEKYQGKDVVYTVNEPTVPTGYTESYDQDTLTVTNTHTPATTTKTVSKAWVDNDNQDGLRTDVTLKLVATVDGAEVAWADLKAASASKADMDDDGLVTLTGKVNESHEFTHLPEKYQGKDVVYTVNEPTVPTGYTESYDQDTLTVTNTHTPATTTKTVSKAWVDNDNQDGLRTDVTLKLVATVDGAEVAWADLKAASASKADMDDDGLVTLTGKVNESHEFTHLPEKYQGKDVVYTVNEPTVPTGYTESYDQDTLTVTNTHTPATTTKTVSKAWVDNDNQDGLRTDVTLKLVATVDGAEVAWADLKAASASKADMDDDGLVTLTGKVNESHEFTHLPEKYQGKDVVYTVNEPTVPTGYTESYDQDTLTVTNTHTPATTTKTVSKAWVDNDNQDGLRTDVTLKLVATVDGAEVAWADLKAASASKADMDDDGLVTLTGKVNESHEFTHLPEKYQGKDVVYTVNEPTVPTGYTESYDQDTLTVTNTHTPATTTKTVSKAWVDNDNQDGLRTDVTLKLVATVDGAEVAWADLKAASASKADMDDDGLVTLTGKVNESHEFTHLPEKYQGKDVVYTVNEPTVPTGYTESYDQDTLTVTNTHTPATTTKTVSKAWVDNDNQDGLRTDVTLKLVATVDGAEVAWADLKAASASKADMDDDGLVTLTGKVNESHEFTHLPEKYQGKDVVYTVNEPTVPTGYTESYDQDTLTVTNTHTPATTTKTVSKAWVDNDNQDGLRTDVTLKLVATVDGAEVAWADLKAASASKADMDDDGLVTLTGKVNESHEFTHLPEKYQGKDVVYTVNEPTVPTGYTESYDQDTLTVTNTHTPATTTKTVSKAWVDNDNQDGLRTDVTLKLVATVDGAEVAWADLKAASASKADMDDDGLVTLTGKVNESHEFTHLPEKYQGKDVVYTVNEPTVPTGYTESYDQDTLTVTNTHTPATTTKTVSKAWVDNDNQDGLRTDVTLKLVATVDGAEVAWADLKAASASKADMDDDGLVTLTGKVNESHEFTHLPEKYQGKDVVYTVNEPTVPTGYTESYDQDTLTVTNTHTPATTTKTVSKAWVDNDNQDGLRTDVTLKLVATVDGAEVAWADLKAASASKADMDDDGLVTLTGKVNESHEFTHLPEKYQGKDVVYTVNEPTVPTGYTESYDQDTLTVTNTHTPATTTKTVSKAWVDNDNQDGLRTDVTLKLVATVDGAEVAWADLKAASASKADMDDDGLVTLTGKVNESHEFTHLPEKYQGKDVVYTVNEPTVPTGYTESYDQDTLTVTNTHTPATTTKTVSKAWVDNDNQDGLRTDVTLKLVATVDGAEVAWADLKAASASKADMDDDGLVTLTGKVNESHEFTHLPEKYQGKDVVYTVNEPTVPTGYTESYDQDTLTVTNTHTPATTTKTVSKAWVDNDNQDGLRTDVTLKLVATVDGAEVAWADLKAASASKADMDDDGLVTLTGKVNESHEFTHLPEKYQGKDVVYTVNEPTVPTGYTESYDQDTLTVTNTHPASTGITFSGIKNLVGRMTLKADEFKFLLEGTDIIGQQEAGNAAVSGNFQFAPIKYTVAGTYTYTIKEKTPSGVLGVTDDITEYDVVVTAIDDTVGKLHITSVLVNGQEHVAKNETVEGDFSFKFNFINIYKANGEFDVDAEIGVTKKLEAGGRLLKVDEFSFTLSSEDDLDNAMQTAKNAADGTVSFAKLLYDEADIGKTYTYKVVENIPADADKEAGMTYSSNILAFKVTVTDNGDGTLTTTKTMVSGETEFVNKYEADGEFDVDAEIGVTKKLEAGGRLLKADEFSFTLSSEDDLDNATQTVKNAADGTVSFANLVYDEADIGKTYTYKVVENIPADADKETGMSYSTNILSFKVTVTDAGNGVLNTAKTMVSGETEFVNKYEADGEFDVDAEIGVTKKLEAGGRLLKADEFSFTLSSEDDLDNATQTVKNAADGTVSFANLVYDEADIGKTYTYKVVENIPADADKETGMSYSTNILSFKVTVTDAGNGVLNTAKTMVSGETEFVNAYEADGELDIETTINPTKSLTGRDLTAGEFNFELRQGGTLVQSATNDAEGNILFSPLVYTEEDIDQTFSYTIVEIPGTEANMTYSEMSIDFTVLVEDAGDGVLSLKVNAPTDVIFFNVYTAPVPEPIPVPIPNFDLGIVSSNVADCLE
ncbi:MAG: Cna B-type domain-containing protein [Christensenellales bacterium]